MGKTLKKVEKKKVDWVTVFSGIAVTITFVLAKDTIDDFNSFINVGREDASSAEFNDKLYAKTTAVMDTEAYCRYLAYVHIAAILLRYLLICELESVWIFFERSGFELFLITYYVWEVAGEYNYLVNIFFQIFRNRIFFSRKYAQFSIK